MDNPQAVGRVGNRLNDIDCADEKSLRLLPQALFSAWIGISRLLALYA